MLAALVIALFVQDAPLPEGPTVLASRIAEVIVHRTLARVTRTVEVPGDGRYLIEGLPGLVHRDSVHVRLSEGSVASVEVRERKARTVPEAEIEALRAAFDAVVAEKRVLTDEQGLRTTARDHYAKLLAVQKEEHDLEMVAAQPRPESWAANLGFVLDGIEAEQGRLRDVEARLAEVEARRKAAHDALGKALASEVQYVDVGVEVAAPPGARLELEYVVTKASWAPIYELRTANDAASIDFVYRARITQMTGEDWTDCALVLSTAAPERGAKGLDPQPTKARITDGQAGPASTATPKSGAPATAAPFSAPADDTNGITADPLTDRAAVEAQGLSLQFRLPDRQTIPSRMEAASVLIGARRLTSQPEHLVTPAVDPTVWLRGRTQNSTPWVMLPGTAAVFFGSDFIGTARFTDPVMPGQGFTLHLGSDPGLSCERVQTSDYHEESTLFSRQQTQRRGFRITLENNGGHPSREDGSVQVIVRQAIPVPADDRIEIEVVSESRPPSGDERWRKDLQDLGIRTWAVDVPRGGKVDVLFEVRMSWPDDLGMRVDGSW